MLRWRRVTASQPVVPTDQIDWSCTAYEHGKLYAGQYRSATDPTDTNHMKIGLTIRGTEMALKVLRWEEYDVKQRDDVLFWSKDKSTASWITTETKKQRQNPNKNGYDICSIVIPLFLRKIGKRACLATT